MFAYAYNYQLVLFQQLSQLITDPLFILFAGVLTVVLMIVVLRVNAFLSLLTAALCVSFLTPLKEGEFWDTNVKDVGNAFGLMAGNVGILVAMGAVIGKCMLDSGAAERIIEAIQNFFGKKLLPAALLSSGFLLSIPVFYDATFYLLVPIARSLYQSTKKNCILYLMTIGLGATLSHTLIPPTPGPVAVAETLNVPLGSMLIVSLFVGILTAPFALGIAMLMNRMLPNPAVCYTSNVNQNEINQPEKTETAAVRPSLFWSLVPIILPIVLIANQTTLEMLEKAGTLVWWEHSLPLKNLCRLLGDPRFALILSAITAMYVLLSVRRLTLQGLSNRMEPALADAGMIILITAAGGAFGEMLRRADVGGRISGMFHNEDGLTGITLLFAAFCISAIIKTAQGSSTTAMITTAGIFKGILVSSSAAAAELPFNTAYLAVAIGLGSCVTGWMNDSGFWIFCRMGGIKESDALRTWTVGLVLLGVSGMQAVFVLSQILPLKILP